MTTKRETTLLEIRDIIMEEAEEAVENQQSACNNEVFQYWKGVEYICDHFISKIDELREEE